jgi:hypothetical protein
MWYNVASFAVVFLYLFWKNYRQAIVRRQRAVRERVAYMLWTMAQQVESPRGPVAAR